VQHAQAEARDELPADDLVPDPSASAASADVLYDFGEDDLATTPYQSDYPPPNATDHRRSWPIIPPAPLPDFTLDREAHQLPRHQPPYQPTQEPAHPATHQPVTHSANYSSWPPTVLEARATMASWSSVAGSSWQTFVNRTQMVLTRVAWQARSFAHQARLWFEERFAGIDEGHKGWMRAKAPYAAGLVIVATSMFSIGRTFEPATDEAGSDKASSDEASSDEAKAAGTASAEGNATIRAEGTTTQARVVESATSSPAALSLPPVPGLSPTADNEAPILVGLAENLSAAGRDAEAVPVLERALARNPELTRDPAFLRALKRAALSEDRTAAVQAYALLVGPMGERGAELLYEISISPAARRSVRERAAYYVYTKDFEHKAPLPLYAAFKLLSAPTCEAKKSLLPFAAEAGGRHALDYLRELDKRKVCSLDDFDNCYPCMNTDEELPDTITKIETRLGT
jgi:hypothetical protein